MDADNPNASPRPSRPHARRRLVALGALASCALALAGLALALPPEVREDVRARAGEAVVWVRALGPGWFFLAFAVLPAAGFPVSIFALSAGPLFAPALGLPAVLALALASMATSLTISYVLARHALRPWAERLLDYLGYRIPEIPEKRRRMVVFLVRVTPGPPYVFQSFLLGLAGVPFGVYFPISLAVSGASALLLIVFGDALFKGSAPVALAALLGLFLAAALLRALRRRALGGTDR